jgi:hypothetical protein
MLQLARVERIDTVLNPPRCGRQQVLGRIARNSLCGAQVPTKARVVRGPALEVPLSG